MEGLKKHMDFSIFGLVGGSGRGQKPYLKKLKNMTFKSILDHFKLF